MQTHETEIDKKRKEDWQDKTGLLLEHKEASAARSNLYDCRCNFYWSASITVPFSDT